MPSPLHVLVAGAGVAALEATLALKALAEERVDVEVLAPEDDFVCVQDLPGRGAAV